MRSPHIANLVKGKSNKNNSIPLSSFSLAWHLSKLAKYSPCLCVWTNRNGFVYEADIITPGVRNR